MRAKPALGYPSRTEAALALRRQGKTYREIGAAIGINENQTAALINSGKRAKARRFVTVHLPRALFDALEAPARKRRTTPELLAAKLLELVAADGLIDAILDDGAA